MGNPLNNPLSPGSSAALLSAAFNDGRLTSSELLEQSFACIHRANEALGAFVHLDEGGAMAAAKASDKRIALGKRLSPLDGVPISVKDNLWVAGMPARWGSRMWADFVPPRDDVVVERLKGAGAVIVGKTNTPEFAFAGRTSSLLHGPARNPWNTDLTPGGSSGGAAASVAAGMTPFAIATDAGGSIRLPASYTGLYGLRPSNGRIPRRHGFPPIAFNLQTIGVLSRSLDDLTAVYRIVAGADPRDPDSQTFVHELAEGVPETKAHRLKIGWFASHGDESVHPEVAEAVRECAGLFEGLDCEVVACEPPYDISAIRSIWSALGAAGVARAVEIHPNRWASEASGPIIANAERGLRMSASDYVRALDELAAFRRNVAANWGEFDAFLCPSAASPAWPLEDAFPEFVDGRPGHAFVQNTFATWVNAIGHPGLSIPARPHTDGRPLGIQIVGQMGEERTILELARRLEGAACWTVPHFPVW